MSIGNKFIYDCYTNNLAEIANCVDEMDFRHIIHIVKTGTTQMLDLLVDKCEELSKEDICSIIDTASGYGKVEFLEWWDLHNLPFEYTSYALDDASNYGYIKVLEWWETHNYELKYTIFAINNIKHFVSLETQLAVMGWWLRMSHCGITLLYDSRIIDSLFENKNVTLLEWWFNSGLPLKYTAKCIDNASQYGHLEILGVWLKASYQGVKLLYTAKSIDLIVCNGTPLIKTLEWWMESGLEIRYTSNFIDSLCEHGCVSTLNFMFNSGLKMLYTENAIDLASRYGHTEILDCWMESGLKMLYTNKSVDEASYCNHINVLDWWFTARKDIGLEMRYTDVALDFAVFYKSYRAVRWWFDSGLPLLYTSIFLDYITDDINGLEYFNLMVASGERLIYTSKSLNTSSEKGNHCYLEKWIELKNMGYPLLYTERCIDQAIATKNFGILRWWIEQSKNGVDLRYSNYVVIMAHQSSYSTVLEYLESLVE